MTDPHPHTEPIAYVLEDGAITRTDPERAVEEFWEEP